MIKNTATFSSPVWQGKEHKRKKGKFPITKLFSALINLNSADLGISQPNENHIY